MNYFGPLSSLSPLIYSIVFFHSRKWARSSRTYQAKFHLVFYLSFDSGRSINSDYAMYVQKVFFMLYYCMMSGSKLLFLVIFYLHPCLICELYHLSFDLLALLRMFELKQILVMDPPLVD